MQYIRTFKAFFKSLLTIMFIMLELNYVVGTNGETSVDCDFKIIVRYLHNHILVVLYVYAVLLDKELFQTKKK